MKYSIELTEGQARVVNNALDLYARIWMGQIEEPFSILRLFTGRYPKTWNDERFVKEALETFLVETNRENKLGGWYSNISGHYFSTGLNVRAAIEGLGIFGKPTIFLVYENTKETADWKWYTDALLIVKETILYVLTSDNPTKYGLIWSS